MDFISILQLAVNSPETSDFSVELIFLEKKTFHPVSSVFTVGGVLVILKVMVQSVFFYDAPFRRR